MAIANKFGYILLNTSNKSELATGYGTLYGDMAGGLGVLGDCYKLQVYELAKYINRHQEIIPKNIITKAPSAELRPNQKDSDSIPDYAVLDQILYQYIFNACQQVRTFLDVLTNWYIRRSRDRFWKGDKDAIDTLHTVLQVLTRIAAPLLPLTTEKIYKELTGERSVHLEDWPDASIVPSDDELEKVMDQVRDVCSTTLSLRKVHSRRVRLPLGELTVASPLANALQSFVSIITDEVNVHKVTLTTELGQVAKHELQLIPAALGPRLGANTQKVIVAVKKGDWSINGDEVIAGGVSLEPHEFQVRLVAAAGDTEKIASAALADGQGIVLLNIELTDALLAEGAARDIVRMVQQARREAGLAVSDRIVLKLGLPDSLQSQVSQFEAYIASETLAQRIEWVQGLDPTGDLDGNPVHIGVDQVR